MWTLHLHWQPPASYAEEGGFIVWMEDCTGPAPTRQSRSKKARPHPFALSARRLEAFLQILAMKISPEPFYPSALEFDLLLPTTRFGPQPSTQLLHDWFEDDEEEEDASDLRRWRIPGVWISTGDAYSLLLQTQQAPTYTPGTIQMFDLFGPEGLPLPEELRGDPSRPSPVQEVPISLGGDILFWRHATQYVMELITQQKFLPALVRDKKQGLFFARWRPVLDAPSDEERILLLQEAMPPLCRGAAELTRRQAHPRRLLQDFLFELLDLLVRVWGQDAVSLPTSETLPAQRWMHALFVDPKIPLQGSEAQLDHLHISYLHWARNLKVSGDPKFRVGMRLEAPTQQDISPDEHAWVLHFFLQARKDPSLVLPARDLWNSPLDPKVAPPNAQTMLLAGLGYAARHFSPIQRGLRSSKPAELALSSFEAYEFVRQAAPILEASGFGILVPPWWNRPGHHLGVRLSLSSSSQFASAETENKGLMNFGNIVNYQWELSLGDTSISRQEFEALVALKCPLIQIRGQWVHLDTEQIDAAIEFWKLHGEQGSLSLQEMLTLTDQNTKAFRGLPLDQLKLDTSLDSWLKRLTQQEELEILDPPDGLNATLRPYQQFGSSWLYFMRRWGFHPCLADDMGLGKTIMAITLLLDDKENDRLEGPSLLICPTSVLLNWRKEIERFAPELKPLVHHGPSRLQGADLAEALEEQEIDVLITSYALARLDLETFLPISWYGLILDEAQNIKNPDAKQTQAIRKLEASFRLALTGTPLENRLSELWSIMHFLNPGYLGNRSSFRTKFINPIEKNKDIKAVEQLKSIISPLFLRRVKTDPTVISDLPEKIEIKDYCTLSEEQASLYESVVQEGMGAIEKTQGFKQKGLVLNMLLKLKQICNHPALFLKQVDSFSAANLSQELERSGKLMRLCELIDEILASDEHLLLFSQFKEMGQLLRLQLQHTFKTPTLFLHGGSSPRQREQMIKRFQEEEDGPRIFILSLKAGGTGLNLTRANHVIHYDRWWNPAVEDQATDRAFRIGQTRNVQVHKFVCVGTLEELIDTMIEEKKSLAQNIIGQGENWLSELDTNTLRELVTLRKEAL